MTSLTAIFGSAPDNEDEKEHDSEKLLDLYWNRAELKKEFAALREENFKLGDRIKYHEGATARVQQKLDHVESLLLDPEWVYNVATFFQLRRLSMSCAGKIARFAEQLKQQREQRQQSKALFDWNEKRKRTANAIQGQINDRRLQAQLLEDQLQAERHRLATMNGFLRFFRRRSLTRSLDAIAEDIDASQAQERELLQQLEDLQNAEPPGQQGLDVIAKRSINFMILAYAQQLFLHFADDELASLSKEAHEKSVGAINYGGKENCDFLIDRISKRIAALEKISDRPEVLQQRAQLIAENAAFRNDDEAVPIPATVSTVYIIDSNGIATRDGNLLGDNYWELAKVVSR